MKTAFVATSFKHRHAMQDVLTTIRQQLSENGYQPLVFVQQYDFAPDETQTMMETSFGHIADCDLFIAELTHKVVGVGIEAGYAYACKKPILYLHHIDSDRSTTLSGIATYYMTYADTEDLRTKLSQMLVLK